MLYLCLTRPCVTAELTRQAARQNIRVEDLLPRELYEISADLERVLDLTDADVLDTLGVAAADLVREDQILTREIGEAAHEHRFQAIRSPSTTGVDHILAIVPGNLAGAVVHVELIDEWTTIADLTQS